MSVGRKSARDVGRFVGIDDDENDNNDDIIDINDNKIL